MWSFVGDKGNKQWIWLALEAATREIVGVHVRGRDRAGAEGLWRSLPGLYRQCAVSYTDFWSSYEEVFPSSRHRAVGKCEGKTNHIERFNCTLRQRVSRLVRKTPRVLEEACQPHRGHLALRSSLQRILTTLALPENGWVASYTPQGALRWAAEIAGGGFQGVSDVAADAEGGATAVGFFSGTVDFDPGPDALELTATDSDLFVVSYDARGALRFAFSLDGPESVQSAYVALDASGFVYVTGSLPRNTPIDFDPGADEFVLTAQSGSFEAGFLAAYTLDGSLLWAGLIEGLGLLRPRGIAPRPGGGVALTGEFSNTVDFDPSSAEATLASSGSADAFVAVYDAGGVFELVYQIGDNGFDTGIGVAVDSQNRTALSGYRGL